MSQESQNDKSYIDKLIDVATSKVSFHITDKEDALFQDFLSKSGMASGHMKVNKTFIYNEFLKYFPDESYTPKVFKTLLLKYIKHKTIKGKCYFYISKLYEKKERSS